MTKSNGKRGLALVHTGDGRGKSTSAFDAGISARATIEF